MSRKPSPPSARKREGPAPKEWEGEREARSFQDIYLEFPRKRELCRYKKGGGPKGTSTNYYIQTVISSFRLHPVLQLSER